MSGGRDEEHVVAGLRGGRTDAGMQIIGFFTSLGSIKACAKGRLHK